MEKDHVKEVTPEFMEKLLLLMENFGFVVLAERQVIVSRLDCIRFD